MKIRMNRCCTFILISLLSLFSFVAQAGAQDNIVNQLSRLPKLRGKTATTHNAKSADAPSGYTYSVLYSFCSASNCADGSYPYAGLIQDAAGNLYGTTYYGGANQSGTVFKLNSAGKETVLYSFGSQSGDGANPTAGLALDTKGNLYGTTFGGGEYGSGTVFEITSPGAETVLLSFDPGSGDDGYSPRAGLVLDAEGNLYGTTPWGGSPSYKDGMVFEITSAGTEKVLWSFPGQSGDGYLPTAGLVFDKEGNLYGTTEVGGAYDHYGTVFKLNSAGKETVLYSFGSQSGDGAYPDAGLVLDAKGNLYGTTPQGGAYSQGTVFEITSAGTEKVLYSFGSQSGDGANPYAGLVFDTKGNLYGTTYGGGAYSQGTVFEITSAGTEKVLYSFGSQSGDGAGPYGLVFDTKGDLYGTTNGGGANGAGTVFKLAISCTANVSLSFPAGGVTGNPYIQATFIAPNSSTLVDYAAACGFASFNWQQLITVLPAGSSIVPNVPSNVPDNVNPANCSSVPPSNWQASSCSMVAGPSSLTGNVLDYPNISDPPNGGYTYWSQNPYPFTYPPYPSLWFDNGVTCTVGQDCPPFPYVVSPDGTTLSFVDAPSDHALGNPAAPPSPDPPAGKFVAFSTSLVGVDSQGQPHTLSSWTWNSTFNGTAGGITQTASIYPIDPGSGTGGVTVMSVNGVPSPTVTVAPASSSITTAQALTVTIAVAGTSGDPTPTGTVTLSSGSYSSAATTLSSGSATIMIPAGSLAVGSDTLTASYAPSASISATYAVGFGSAIVTVTATGPPSFTISGTNVAITPGATTGNTSTITVTPSGGFTGNVKLTAAITSSPTGAQDPPTFSFGSTSPVDITGASAGTATLTVSTTAASSGALAYPLRPGVRWYATGSAGLAFALVLGMGVPTRRRSWRARLGLLVFLMALIGGLLACGGGSSGGGTSNPGTTPGTYTVTVSGTSGSTTATGTVTLTVE